MENAPEDKNLVLETSAKNNRKKIFKIIVLALVLIIIIIAIIFVYILVVSKAKKAEDTGNKTTNENKATATISNEQKIEQTQKAFKKAIENTAKVDKDFDGILDKDEIKYGTSPTSADTDFDGITDKDEIFLYKTNPLKADTDGDGFTDGEEVRRGYNPNGEGDL